jgi:hypothetical protein
VVIFLGVRDEAAKASSSDEMLIKMLTKNRRKRRTDSILGALAYMFVYK